MVPGYNHNIKYKDVVYHVQTEDSGLENPHVITHLFVGGNIIESRKTSYANIVSMTNLTGRIKQMMQLQHKSLLKGLIQGKFDHKLAARSVNAAHLDGPAPINVDAGAQQRTSFGIAEPAVPNVVEPAPVQPEVPSTPFSAPVPPPLPPSRKPVFVEPAQQVAFADEPASSFFGNAPPPEKVIEAETLERAFEQNDLAAVDSIFGEDLISEKSLDEVILSYLAEDMQND